MRNGAIADRRKPSLLDACGPVGSRSKREECLERRFLAKSIDEM